MLHAQRRHADSVPLLILRIGFIAGTLDIADALIFSYVRGVHPQAVLQFIASGLIGPASFRGGAATAALGLVLHYCIALIWTIVFFAVSRRFKILYQRPVVSGALYGGAVYLVMNFIVLPLSNIPPARHPVTIASRVNGVLAVVLFIGLTISLLLRQDSVARIRR